MSKQHEGHIRIVTRKEIWNKRVLTMGTIIKNLGGRRPTIYIERRIDDIEIQKLLVFHLTNDSWLSTETEDSIRLFGRDENHLGYWKNKEI